MVVAVAGLLGAAAVLRAFARWERDGRPHVVVGVLLGVLLFEAVLLPEQAQVPVGLFRVSFGGQDVRLSEILLVLALVARASVRRVPTRLTLPGLLWTAFFAWYATAALAGYLRGHDLEVVLFEAKSLLYVPAAFVLVAGCDVERVIAREVVARWFTIVAAVVAYVAATMLVGTYRDLSVPGQRLPAFGNYGTAGRSLVAALAVVLLATEACRARPRPRWLVVGLLLLVSPIVGLQRAAMLGAAAGGAALVLATLGRTWRRRVRVTGTQIGLVAAALVALAVVAIGVPWLTSDERPALVASLDEAFFGEGQVASAESRQRLWSETRELIGEHPVAGWGLGQRTELVKPFPREPVEVSAHNVVLDVLVRSGVIGLVAIAAALAASLADAARVWRQHPEPVVAGFALGCAAALVGLVAKGMVESILENYRLAETIGLLLGSIAAAARSLDARHRGAAWSRSGAIAVAG